MKNQKKSRTKRTDKLKYSHQISYGKENELNDDASSKENHQENREHSLILFENAPYGVLLCKLLKDPNGKPVDCIYLSANTKIAEHAGVGLGTIIGKTASEIGPFEEMAESIQLFGRVVSTGTAEKHIKHFPVCGLTLELTAFPCKNDLFVVSFHDITERKQIEEDRIAVERQIQGTHKFESLMNLAGGVAHDFNNLLMGIIGNVDLIMRNMAPDDPINQNVHAINSAANRAADLTRQMLAYSGKDHFCLVPLTLQALVVEMKPSFRDSFSKEIEFSYQFSEDAPLIAADSSQLKRLIVSLVNNAAESLGEEGGIVTIRTGVMDYNEDNLAESHVDYDLPKGRYSYLEISDNGHGIDPTIRDNIFDPFFTTKFIGRGLGLSSVLGIVQGHNGAIKVFSEPGQGSTFRVLLPVEKTAYGIADISNSSNGDLSLKCKTILLVDDQETVRTVCQQMLERLGCVVATARDGKEALLLFKQAPGLFDCILLDYMMPNMDGEKTFNGYAVWTNASSLFCPAVIMRVYSLSVLADRITRALSKNRIE